MLESEILQNSMPITMMAGQDRAETDQLREMLNRAEAYLTSFKWCPKVVERRFGCGVGGVVAIFLFRLEEKVHDTDDLLWVIEGDLPSAYLVTDRAPDPESALSVYADLMDDWAQAVLNCSSTDSVFPVAASRTPEFAKMLLLRTQFLRAKILPLCRRYSYWGQDKGTGKIKGDTQN